jgi:hypothetical protein
VRVLGAGAVPALAAALFFSFSRGSFGAAVIGLVVYALLARPRGLLPALVATGPATALAISAVYGAEVLSSDAFAGAAGVVEGRDVARTLAIATVAALALRAATLPLDAKLAALEIPRAVTRASAAVGVLAAIGAALALGLPGYAERQYERFKEPLPPNLENRDRFFVPSNNDRLAIWRIAEDEFASERVRGTGAGTIELS